MKKMRLDKWLADAGVGTRSEVKNYIRKKQVLVNDLPVTDPGFQVTEQDSICYQGRQIGQKGNVYYVPQAGGLCQCNGRCRQDSA